MNAHGFPVHLGGASAEVRMWAYPGDVESKALDQLRRLSTLPNLHGIAVMPDVHLGIGATVGSVVAMRDAVCPAAVGVDIGCGMSAVRTNVTQEQLPDDLHPMRSSIEAKVPVGFSEHKESIAAKHPIWDSFEDLHEKVQHRMGKAMRQIGTLGGGNHFIEVTTDTTGQVWLMLHSGSRNIGNEIARVHIGLAQRLEHNRGLVDRDLAYFVNRTPEWAAYVHDLHWAQEYARVNREYMLNRVMAAFTDAMGREVAYDEPISCHHNYVSHEEYDGVQLVVTRKGAIRAGSGELGLIPGSMGTGSYVVRGLGNAAAYQSASHGAGRKMSRNRARAQFTAADLAEQTRGVECRKDAGVVDEIPGAYKDLETVIDYQRDDLIEVVERLTTLLCVKG